jgi:hypothetical protein
MTFKKKWAGLRRRAPAPTPARVEKLTRQLWEFGEEIRLARLDLHPITPKPGVLRTPDREERA